MNWLYYLAEANIYLGVFYLAHCLFLNRDTHYQLSRAYLVFSCIAAFILPVVQIGALRPARTTERITAVQYALPMPTAGIMIPQPQTITVAAPVAEHPITLQDGLWYLYLAGAAVAVCMLLMKLYTLFRLMRSGQRVYEGRRRLVYLNGTDTAFSFFNYLFIGTETAEAGTIIRHELVHIRQKHSLDIIFLELLKIVNWFNPLVYLLQNSLKTIHEYIADEHTAAHETDALAYSSLLLKNAYGLGGSSITHSFFNYNLLKKRIIMLNQQRSGNLARLKYLAALPICAAMLCTSTLAFSKTYGWIDLAPTHVHTAIFVNHPVKHKRLKITQNGVTTVTDQFSIDKKNQKVIYTAGNITKADRSSLLKYHHLKVEVVEDSTLYTTKDGKPFLPVVNVDGYYQLDHFLHNNIHYTPAKGEKGGFVEIAFALDNDRHITDAKIAISGGPKLDALALNGFKAYKGIVNDDGGKNYKLVVYFFTNDYSIFKTDSIQKENDPEYAGELIITGYKYPANLTSKGYEYEESGIGFPGDDNNMKFARVIIYDKNGEATWFYRSKLNPADLKLLKDKYGYTFPSGASPVVQMMYPNNAQLKHVAYIYTIASYLEAPYSNHFYNHILNNIEYPGQAKKELKGGVVILNFNLDKEGMIGDVNVAQSAGSGFDEAAVSALRSYKFAINDKAGRHSIAIVFCVAEKKYRPAVSDKIKKDGYVGELAVSDVKSPFVSSDVKFPPPVGKKN